MFTSNLMLINTSFFNIVHKVNILIVSKKVFSYNRSNHVSSIVNHLNLSSSIIRTGLKIRQTRQLPRAFKQEGPPGFYHSKAIGIEL